MFHPNFDTTLNDPFTKGLACAAITPGLRSILVFNASYTKLMATANILSQMLETATGRQVKQVSLGVSETDDDLWGSLVLSNDNESSPFVWKQGSLAGLWSDTSIRLVMIPDLSKLNLAAVRACVMLIGADVAHLERYDRHEIWAPNMCWLASCATAEVGSISPHLLDRFALRLNWRERGRSDRTVVLLNEVLTDQPFDDIMDIPLSADLSDCIRRATRNWAEPGDKKALDRVCYYTSNSGVYSPRRELALMRQAVAIARLEGKSEVTTSHVDAAAQLIGLRSIVNATQERQRPNDQFASTTEEPDQSHQAINPERTQDEAQAVAQQTSEKVYKPDQTVILEQASLTVPYSPYPEDKAPVEREVASLRLPVFRYAAASSDRGTVIGVEQTNTLHDLALVSTFFAAAPFQPIRHKYRPEDAHHILFSASDLRSYRREPAADQMLLVLLDYTSLRDCDWLEALLPYLKKAYTDRAHICIVQVGVASASNELRAELVSARSMLVPGIASALFAKPGKATPLAHGFDLALRTLRHALHHGRSTVRQAVLIVISDGRGNVPLEASRSGRLIAPINREGIDDALRIAELICGLKEMQTVLLNPQPASYPELPLTLADALGAEAMNIRRLI